MPAILAGPPQCNQQMWQALKVHITRERQRKKQEQEADAEEERLRKERERQQKQDVMTLGETREQISNLEKELSHLKDEKHQLFLQLKKVLNEDDNRRRQLIKETSACSEVLTMVGGYPGTGSRVVHPQLFLPMPPSNSPLYKVTAGAPTHLLPSGAMKRPHSPSSPPVPSSYHSVYSYKPPSIPNYNPPPPKSEEAARRSGDSRVVLWNKSNQYSMSNFYSAPTDQSVYNYSTTQSSREFSESSKAVYLVGSRTPLATHQSTYVTNLHSIEHNKSTYGEDKFYLRPTNHVTVHGGAIPIQQPPQDAKTGGIISGYPMRELQQLPPPLPPPGLYPSPSPSPSPPPPPLPSPPPPTTMTTTTPTPPPPSPPPGTYVSGSGSNIPGRLLYTQPGPRYFQREM